MEIIRADVRIAVMATHGLTDEEINESPTLYHYATRYAFVQLQPWEGAK